MDDDWYEKREIGFNFSHAQIMLFMFHLRLLLLFIYYIKDSSKVSEKKFFKFVPLCITLIELMKWSDRFAALLDLFIKNRI